MEHHKMQTDELRKEAHEQWLTHPITVQLLKNLEKHKQTFITNITARVNDLVPDAYFRNAASNVKTIDTMVTMIREYTTFEILTKQ